MIKGESIEISTDYQFPNTWRILRLGNVCRLIDGHKTEGKAVCLDARFLRGNSSPNYLTKGKLVRNGDYIILVDGENSGEVFAVMTQGYLGSTFKQLWISSEIYVPYVIRFIEFYKDTLRNSKKGAAIPHLNKEIFYNLIIGIPPFKEQKRIVDRINELSQLLK